MVEGKLKTKLVERAIEGVGRVKCYATEDGLSTSSERVLDLVDGKGKQATPNAVEEAERATCYTLESDSDTLSEMVHELVEGKPEKGK